MTFYYYEENKPKDHMCTMCSIPMKEDKVVLGIQIYRCPCCGDWEEE